MSLTDPTSLEVNGVVAAFAEGVVAVGDLEVEIRSRDVDAGRRLDVIVRNPGRDAIGLGDVVVRVAATPEQVLEHGHQSWSVVRRCSAKDVRPERAELPDWARGTHLSRPDGAGHVIAGDQFLLTSDGVAGFLDAKNHLGTVEAEAGGVAVRAMFDGVVLAAGAARALEPIWLADGDAGERYSDFVSLWGLTAGARMSAPAPLGWCSWYQYFADVTPDDVRANLEAIAGRGFDVVQIDDGYQRAIGDWLSTADAWAEGLGPLVHEIQHAGLQPGIWTAPFLVGTDSEVFAANPEWVSTHGPTGHPSKAAYNPGNWGGWALALDTTRPEVLDHLRVTYAALVDQGFDYHKIDFCYAAALPARRHDPTKTRAESLRAGLDAVREGIGDGAFLLGCGCPFGPAVGVVDAMRVSADVAPVWAPDNHWPGLYEAAPAAVNAIAASVLRAPMHRRLFINDPDCLLLRPTDTRLDAGQRSFLAAVITGTGAFTLVSDDMRRYSDAEWGLLEALRSVHDDVDTLLDIDDPFADPIVVRSAAGTLLTVDWRDDAPGGPVAQLGLAE
ncbi:MAG TPA: glycoside hydrolase family 36 protein [Acidimicrobiales bacterium]|nr:glycoside hydrolase family 36 protein [Acidimicrobiales bacterium]